MSLAAACFVFVCLFVCVTVGAGATVFFFPKQTDPAVLKKCIGVWGTAVLMGGWEGECACVCVDQRPFFFFVLLPNTHTHTLITLYMYQ
jgi:hypothetical protein